MKGGRLGTRRYLNVTPCARTCFVKVHDQSSYWKASLTPISAHLSCLLPPIVNSSLRTGTHPMWRGHRSLGEASPPTETAQTPRMPLLRSSHRGGARGNSIRRVY